jgi:hypothetical protein
MPKRTLILFAVALLATCGFAKDKKHTLPGYVLQAHTVAVIIDPSAGVSMEDPRANEIAQKAVETALLNWGRFQPTFSRQSADLIIVVRKGNGRLANETIPDARQNNRAGAITPMDNGVSAAGQHGSQPNISNDGLGPTQGPARPQMEVGEADDSFLVYEGGVENPLDSSPAWRYVAKDGLSSDTVPAVAAFRKAVADAEKAAAKTP